MLPYIAAGEKRPLKAIETAEAWAKGKKVTLDQVRDAASAARAASAAYVAYAAARAASAAYVAYAAASAAAYAAARAAANAAGRDQINAQMCEIVRKHYSRYPRESAIRAAKEGDTK